MQLEVENAVKLSELISRYNWPEVESQYVRLYPDEKSHTDRAGEAFAYIKALIPGNTVMQIDIAYREEEDGGYHDVYGKDGSVREDGLEERFCLALVDWGEWLGMEIEPEVQERYSDLDIVCHCFWEMTWHGYAMDMVMAAREDLRRRAADPDTVTALDWRKVLEET